MIAKTKNMLRAGQLAELAGVSLPTIKHYVNEGLIPKPFKTGKTMAYYDEACIDKIKLIKKLQKEKFLPLDVIKRALDSGAAYEEELELGQAILKPSKLAPGIKPVSEAHIERRTGYPLHKIRLLEKEGLVLPTLGDGGKYYDSIDCKIIEIVKRREALGVSFDYSVETIRLYRDAIEEAVRRDIRLFVRSLLGDISTRQTVKFLTEADDSLDNFVVLIRQKLLRSFSQAAIRQMNNLPGKLAMLSFLPQDGTELPENPPEEQPYKIIYLFLTGAYDSIATDRCAPLEKNNSHHAAAVIANLLCGNPEAALQIVERYIPKPTARALDNTAAALACMFAIGRASGFSSPIYLAKKGLAYLKRVETARASDVLIGMFSQYICGAIYTMLPDIFDTKEKGIKIMARLAKFLRNRKMPRNRYPIWLARTLHYEILPAVEVRANRFLAEGYLRQGDHLKAGACLERLIEIADAEDEHAKWARLKKLE